MPAGLSSITRHGLAPPRRCAAYRNRSGAGLPRATIVALNRYFAKTSQETGQLELAADLLRGAARCDANGKLQKVERLSDSLNRCKQQAEPASVSESDLPVPGAAGYQPTLGTAHKIRHENVNARHGSIGFVPAVPRRLESRKALRDAYCSPAEELGRVDIVVEPVADHYRVRRCTAGPRERPARKSPIRFFKALLRGGQAERDERY